MDWFLHWHLDGRVKIHWNGRGIARNWLALIEGRQGQRG